ncbi:type II toxin-antitoxin system HigB family toxin [Acinetobacter seifertii]|uniref:type II toxin-antitoxin system HigB family toxin n=1 Tax=Acinetobacter calcoaceticus/baumannii complex TaxID=909768 RepID=UPI00168CFE6C|nr:MULTISPECIES: type II toxin-antitoxin system HigB family toxin [Acinetobacter calcoaceticus/baumannii complex]MBN6523390.1 type II toxin-antitoxin system HigB family toxin [Acinetobacter pittii]MDV7635158.1 type II toxin-antitoxin system HigB family toxin [Acinetobacter baumannii]QNW93751.1 type II toxin-antitoxin system HigB family toxin [Acinetobacter seifertii]QNX00835.1 type II toxin-antitoxin system HigB family toxin [Acinetobacter seifertii]
MRLIGQGKLLTLKMVNSEIQSWLCSWVAEVKHAKWKSAEQVLEQYPLSAKEVSKGVFEFHIRDHTSSILLNINFTQSIAVIAEIKVRDHV